MNLDINFKTFFKPMENSHIVLDSNTQSNYSLPSKLNPLAKSFYYNCSKSKNAIGAPFNSFVAFIVILSCLIMYGINTNFPADISEDAAVKLGEKVCPALCMYTYSNLTESSHDSFIIPGVNENSHLDKNDNVTPYNLLKSIKISNINRLTIAQLNINSLRNKIESLKLLMTGNIDILIITETKLDETFPKQQFWIDGYSPPFE